MISIHELSRQSGVSSRMLRHYDQKELLKPAAYTASGQRLYEEDALIRLQQITVFSYLGYSLSEIRKLLEEARDQKSWSKLLDTQETVLRRESEKLEIMLNLVRKIREKLETDVVNREDIIALIRSARSDEILAQDHQNLRLRHLGLNIYQQSDSYSQDAYLRWIWDHMDLHDGIQIAELDAEEGNLWYCNRDRLPKGVLDEYYLPGAQLIKRDFSDKGFFTCWIPFLDLDQIPDESYDLIYGTYMEIHGDQMEEWLYGIWKKLKPGGKLYTICIDSNHMKERVRWCSIINDGYERAVERRVEVFGIERAEVLLGSVFSHVHVFPRFNTIRLNDEETLLKNLTDRTGYTGRTEAEVRRFVKLRNQIHKEFEKGYVEITTHHYLLEAVKD